MGRVANIVICVVLLVLSITQPITPKRTFSSGRHSYPKSTGLSGGGHSYPSSGGHSYPSSGGLSGHSHGYPSSSGSHGYPPSSGLSGNGHSRPSGSSYPTNTQQTGNHGYPASKGLSGNSPSNSGSHTTNVHYHYNYNPPQQIKYTPVHGGPPMSYPVYHGPPPTYVYKYQDSGSKYGTLLTGLALLNLGTLAGTAYALNKGHSNNYKPQPGEVCKFGIKKDNGDYEETKIDCQIISSFIYQEEAKTTNTSPNVTVVTTTVTNTTTINAPNNDTAKNDTAHNSTDTVTLYEMYPNGTLVPRNETTANTTTLNNATNDSTVTSSVTITTTNTTTVSNAIDIKGKPVEVTPGMHCFVLRHTSTSNMKKSVPCGLLQTYATSSLKKNSASRNVPFITILTAIFSIVISC